MFARSIASILALVLCVAPAHAKKPNLKKVEVSSLELTAIDGSTSLCAGEPGALKIVATLADGSTLDTSSDGSEGLRFKDFDLVTDRGDADKSGVLLVPNTGPELIDQSVNLSVSSKKTPATAEASLALHFGCEVRLDYRAGMQLGAPLPPDASGPNVGKVLAGALGVQITSSNTPPEGERGADGADGGPGGPGAVGGTGGPGAPGLPGPSLSVDVTVLDSGLVLAAIQETSVTGNPRFVVIDPSKGGRLFLDASGGRGGEGGKGGDGGDGGPGIAGYNDGNGGNGGNAGTGGRGGVGGKGGDVTVRYDKAHPELANLVIVRSDGGFGGLGGEAGAFGSGGAGLEGASDGTIGSTSERGPSGPDGAPGKVSVVPTPGSSLAKR